MNKNKIANDFKKILKDLRTERGLSQDEFAKELGISKGAVSYYETGQRVPDIVVLSALADYFGVSTDYLLGRTETKSVNEDIQVACKVTGLTEEAFSGMYKNICEIFFLQDEISIYSEEYKAVVSILSELLQDEDFWFWILALKCLKETSEDGFLHIKNTNRKEIMQAGLILDIEPIILFEYISNSFDETEEVNYEERCDMLKYHAFKESQKICDKFDLSDLRKTFTKEQWLEYLKIDENTLLDLRKQSEEFKREKQQKAGD